MNRIGAIVLGVAIGFGISILITGEASLETLAWLIVFGLVTFLRRGRRKDRDEVA